MQLGMWLRLGFCVIFFSLCLFSYMYKQNELTKLKFQVPKLQKRLQVLEDDIRALEYKNEKLENPARLMELVRFPQFSHLKHPLIRDILLVQEGLALEKTSKDKETILVAPISVHIGAK